MKRKIFFYFFCVIPVLFFFSSCAGVINLQPQVNSLAVARRYDQALKILEDPKNYGSNSELLYLLDRGLVLHLAGRYEESSRVFEEAKNTFDQLYTQSVTKIGGSWLWNDYALPYRGEDFERVMVNIFQALNFAALGKIEEALVEARDVDSVLNAINDQYASGQKNVYREDAFARLLMGILYEAGGNWNDALVSYRRAWDAYEKDYKKNYGVAAPQVLKENFRALIEKQGSANDEPYRRALAGIPYVPWDQKTRQAEIYLIQYEGLAPIKMPVEIIVPVPGGPVSKVAFPYYQKRVYESDALPLTARDIGGRSFMMETEEGEDVETIAIKNLEDRRLRVMAKALIRPVGKYFLERTLENKVSEAHGRGSGRAVQYAGSLYNVFSEQPDLRSWQTLPARVRVARLIVKPGAYEVSAGSEFLGQVTLGAGEKKFFVVRTVK